MKFNRKTIENDERYLRQISQKVDFINDKDYKDEIEAIKEYATETECFALAAIQIGIPKRIIYIKNTDPNISLEDINYNESKFLINPTIMERKGLTKYWEACLSCLDYMGLVSRPYQIKLKYYDENGQEHIEIFEGFKSTVISHELNHLDGILHMDIAEEVLKMSKADRKVFRESHPYDIISKDCRFDKNY